MEGKGVVARGKTKAKTTTASSSSLLRVPDPTQPYKILVTPPPGSASSGGGDPLKAWNTVSPNAFLNESGTTLTVESQGIQLLVFNKGKNRWDIGGPTLPISTVYEYREATSAALRKKDKDVECVWVNTQTISQAYDIINDNLWPEGIAQQNAIPVICTTVNRDYEDVDVGVNVDDGGRGVVSGSGSGSSSDDDELDVKILLPAPLPPHRWPNNPLMFQHFYISSNEPTHSDHSEALAAAVRVAFIRRALPPDVFSTLGATQVEHLNHEFLVLMPGSQDNEQYNRISQESFHGGDGNKVVDDFAIDEEQPSAPAPAPSFRIPETPRANMPPEANNNNNNNDLSSPHTDRYMLNISRAGTMKGARVLDWQSVFREFRFMKSEQVGKVAMRIGVGGYATVARVKLVTDGGAIPEKSSEVLALKIGETLKNHQVEVQLVQRLCEQQKQQQQHWANLWFPRYVGVLEVPLTMLPRESFDTSGVVVMPTAAADSTVVGMLLMENLQCPTLAAAVQKGFTLLERLSNSNNNNNNNNNVALSLGNLSLDIVDDLIKDTIAKEILAQADNNNSENEEKKKQPILKRDEATIECLLALHRLEKDLPDFAEQLLHAVHSLHTNLEVVHRDLTIKNIFVRHWGGQSSLPPRKPRSLASAPNSSSINNSELPSLCECGPVLIDFGTWMHIVPQSAKRGGGGAAAAEERDLSHVEIAHAVENAQTFIGGPPLALSPPEYTLWHKSEMAKPTFDLFLLGTVITWCAVQLTFSDMHSAADRNARILFERGTPRHTEFREVMNDYSNVRGDLDLDFQQSRPFPTEPSDVNVRVFLLGLLAWEFEWDLVPHKQEATRTRNTKVLRLLEALETTRAQLEKDMHRKQTAGATPMFPAVFIVPAETPSQSGVFGALRRAGVNGEFIDMLRNMTQFHPRQRPQTAEAVVRHEPFFKMVRELRTRQLRCTVVAMHQQRVGFGDGGADEKKIHAQLQASAKIVASKLSALLCRRRNALVKQRPRYVGRVGYEWAKSTHEMLVESVSIDNDSTSGISMVQSHENWQAISPTGALRAVRRNGPSVVLLDFTQQSMDESQLRAWIEGSMRMHSISDDDAAVEAASRAPCSPVFWVVLRRNLQRKKPTPLPPPSSSSSSNELDDVQVLVMDDVAESLRQNHTFFLMNVFGAAPSSSSPDKEGWEEKVANALERHNEAWLNRFYSR